MDLRIEGEKEKNKVQYLVGFTVDHQIKGIIKEPVTTLEQAKEWQRKSTHSKVNLNTGEWARRKKKGQEALVNVSLVSQRKKVMPPDWLTMEGVTEVGAIGGTKQYPGVFNIVDKGVAEYGAKKTYMMEIWLWGKVFNGRFLFRELSIKGFAELKKLAKEFQEFSDEEEFNELVHDLRTLGDDEFERFYGIETLKDIKTILGLPENQAVEKFYGRQSPNSPSFAYEAVYQKAPEGFLPGRTGAKERLWNGIPVDIHITDAVLEELNAIPEIELRASCEGHDEKYVSYVVFRLKKEDPAKAAIIAETLNKFEGYYSKADIGPEGKCRIVCAGRTWHGKEGGGWDEFWKNLASKIKLALETAERGETLDKAGKPLVLPVAETAFREEFNWFFIKPLDQVPYTISDRAVEKKWISPEGFSCLPKHVRSQVPEEYRYWHKGLSTSQRLEMRNALVEKMKSKEVKIDMEKSLSKESEPGTGQGVGGTRQGLGGQEYCFCPSCNAVFRHIRGKSCSQSSCPKCGQSLLPYSLRKLYKAMEKNLSKESEPGAGQGAGGPRQRLGGQEYCYCPSCDAVFKHVRGNPCQQSSCPKCGKSLVPYALRKLYKEQ